MVLSARRWSPLVGRALSLCAASLAVMVAAASAQTPAPTADHQQVTFARDIAPILQRSCQQCHRPGSIAPMALLTYEDVRPWARTIKHRTSLRSKPEAMPPWYIEKNIGIQKYKGDYSLSDAEIEKIAKWADSGAPRGNPADMPPPVRFADAKDWQIGTPDLIVKSPMMEIKAGAPDWWGPVGMTPSALTEDRYVAAVEMREVNDLEKRSQRQTIGGLHMVHHLIWSAVADGAPQTELESWPIHEVGRNADVFDPDAGKLLKAGAKLVFPSAHLHSTGTDTKAYVEYGFKFHPKGYKPTKRMRGFDITATLDIDIKPMTADQKIEAYSTLAENTKIVVYEPHMHAAGVRMCMDAIWGTNVQTLSCSGYNHGWVRNYAYEDDYAPLLPKGTIIRITGYFDNTPNNKNVSDPRNWSGLGHRSIDNMLINIGQSITMNDAEFQAEIDKRRERLKLREGEAVIGCPLCGHSRPSVGTTAGQQQQQQ